MNTTWVLRLLLLVSLALVGCKKGPPPGPAPMDLNGVKVDLPKLQEAFQGADQTVQASLSQVTFGIRYRQYPVAFQELEKLSANPSLTEPQKKIVTDVLSQMKQAVAKDPNVK